MIGVNEHKPADTFQCHSKGIGAKLHVKTVKVIPPEDMPGVEFDDHRKAEEAVL